MSGTVHIASLVAHCRPERLEAVRAAIDSDGRAEVHAADPSGKLVIVLETGAEGGIADLTNRIRDIDGVLSCNLVYHGIDEADDVLMQENEG